MNIFACLTDKQDHQSIHQQDNQEEMEDHHQIITEMETQEMERVPYTSNVESLMYVMVCCRPDLAHAMS